MKQIYKARFALAAILGVGLALASAGCRILPGVSGASAGDPSAAAASRAPASAAPGSLAPAATDTAVNTATASPMEQFASDFRMVDANPLDERIQAILWLVANGPDETAVPGGEASAALKELYAKYNALVAGPGVHYKQTAKVMGMETKNEVWMKSGKFKVTSAMFGITTVKLFDGEYYVEYDPAEKKGKRYTKEERALDISGQLNGMVPENTFSVYMPKGDKKIGKFDCSVFTYEMNVMGMKTCTIALDKKTGLLVQYTVDGDMAMENTVTSFDIGGFGDDVFKVPAGITLED